MRFLLLLFLSFSLTACFDSGTATTTTPPDTTTQPDTTPVAVESLVGDWLNSAEEDTATEEIYRPTSFNFPPARARAGFKFKADNTVIRRTINPDDSMKETTGKWEAKGDTEVLVTLDDEAKTSFTMKKDFANGKLLKSK